MINEQEEKHENESVDLSQESEQEELKVYTSPKKASKAKEENLKSLYIKWDICKYPVRLDALKRKLLT